MIHGKRRNEKKTVCGKPIARRWWVAAGRYIERQPFHGMTLIRVVDQRADITCAACRKALRLKEVARVR